MKVQGKSVLIKPDAKPEFTKAGLKIAEEAKRSTNTGEIIGCGKACKEVKVGDKVYYNTSAASIYTEDNTDYHFVIEDEIQFVYGAS